MKQLYLRIRDFLYTREVSIDTRMAMMFITTGMAGNVLITLTLLLAHAHVAAVGVSLFMTVATPVVIYFGNRLHAWDTAPRIIGVLQIIATPLLWVFTGGFRSGVSVYFIYDLFLLFLIASRKRLAFYLAPAILLIAGCFVMEGLCPDVLAYYHNMVSQPVIACGSLIIVTASILLNVLGQKALYLREKQFGDAKKDTTLQFVTSVAAIIDAKDSYTGGHSKRVASCARAIAKAMGMSETDQQDIHLVGLMHDIGKIGVPDTVLNTPGKLTDAQFDMIRRHPVIGGEILRSMDFIPHLCEGAMYHHERWDGKGYPYHLSGEEIPLFARIICVADAFDAMSTDRVYRKRMTTPQIIEEFRRCRGSQFDPAIADIFIGMLEKGLTPSVVDVDTNPSEKSMSSVVNQMLNSAMQSMTDNSRLLSDLHSAGDYQGSMTLDYSDFTRMHEYILRVGNRLGCHFMLLMVSLHASPDHPLDEAGMSHAMDCLGSAISQSVRTVDVCNRYSSNAYLIILLNADENATDQIMHRVKSGYLNIAGDNGTLVNYQVLHK